MNERNFQPNWMSAPGATIADILKEQGLSIDDFAKLMGCSQTRAERLLGGREAITIEMAKLLAQRVGGSTSFWMSREQQYRDDVGYLQSEGDRSAADIWLSELPVRDMTKFGWFASNGTHESKIAACLDFFGVTNVRAWREKYRDVLSVVSFRTSPAFESQPGAVLAWLRYGEIKSAEIDCEAWDSEKFADALFAIRKLTRVKEPNSFVPELQQICAGCGVALIIARAPSGCRASGATRFISTDKAMILLSFRFLSDDQFWFTFFHEAGHLLLHNKNALFLEDGSDVTVDEEIEANRFAGDILVPPHVQPILRSTPLTKENIIRAAVRIGVSRGIIVGQLQHMDRIKPTQFNWLKRRYNWGQIYAG
jgi:HTH-type transcriptional regulator/antitoxin HigA